MFDLEIHVRNMPGELATLRETHGQAGTSKRPDGPSLEVWF